MSAVRSFWDYNTDQLEPDKVSTLVGFAGDTSFEPVIYSDAEVFYGF